MSASEPLSGGSLSSSFDGAMLNALLLARGVAFERVTELSAECEALKKEAERLHSDRLTLQNWLEQERTFRQRDWNWFGVERARFERRERDMLAEREEIKKQRDNQATQVAHALQTIQRAVGLDDVVPRLRSELGQISRQSDFLATQLSQAIEIIQQKDERITQALHAASEIAQERDSLAAQLSQAMETIRQITEKRDLLATQDSRAIQIITQRNEEITVRLSAEANLAHEKDSLPKELSQVIQQSDEQKRVEREIAPEKESSGGIGAECEPEVANYKTQQSTPDDAMPTRKRPHSQRDVSEVEFEKSREKIRKLSPPSRRAARMPPTGRKVEVVITRSPRIRISSKILPTGKRSSAVMYVNRNQVVD